MNEDVNRNRKLFWKGVSKANGGNVENFNRIKDGNVRLALEEAEVFWKEYYEDLYNIDTQEQVGVHIYGSDEVRRLGEWRLKEDWGSLRIEKAGVKDEVTGVMIKSSSDRVVD